MKYHHQTNFILAAAAALLGALINLILFGNIWAAILGAGSVTFLLSLVWNYFMDWLWWYNRSLKS